MLESNSWYRCFLRPWLSNPYSVAYTDRCHRYFLQLGEIGTFCTRRAIGVLSASFGGGAAMTAGAAAAAGSAEVAPPETAPIAAPAADSTPARVEP